MYIGFRDHRYAPEVTSVDTGRCGTIVVRCRTTPATPPSMSPTPDAAMTAPATAVAG